MKRAMFIVLAVALASALPTAYAADGDSDKVEDDVDNCEGSANPLQFDADGDGHGDLCEEPFFIADEFDGTDLTDVIFGTFEPSRLVGGGGSDSLYGGGGDDLLVGGAGLDFLAGGPGNDLLTGGDHCDTFGIEAQIEQRDTITDFNPTIDRVRFPPIAREAQLFPRVERVGVDRLEVAFSVGRSPVLSVVFEGMGPGASIVLSTEPCGQGPPPGFICPKPIAFQTMVFVGFEETFCPGSGKLEFNSGVYATARFGSSATKVLGNQSAAAWQDRALPSRAA